MDNVELLVLRSLLHNEDYARKVVPFIKAEYFEQPSQKIAYEEIADFIVEYDELPSKEALYIEVEKREDVNEEVYKNVKEFLMTILHEIGHALDSKRLGVRKYIKKIVSFSELV